MTERIETIKVEADEQGFELHITTDEGEYRFNMHAVAEAHYDDVKATIGPWLQERDLARAEQEHELRHLDREDEEQWLHESALEHFHRTGNSDPVREQADAIRARWREEVRGVGESRSEG